MDRNLSLLFAVNLAVSFSTQLIQPLFPLYLRDLGASEVEIGLVIALSSVVATAAMLPSGMLIDRVGKKLLLLVSVVFSTISPVFLAFLADWRLLTLPYMIFNAAFSFFVPARMAMIAETATNENMATMFGLMNVAWPIGGIVGPVLSGFLIENMGWGQVFYASAAIGGASLIPTLLLREKTVRRGAEARKGGLKELLGKQYSATMVLFFAFHMVEMAGLGAVNMILPLYLQDRLQLSYYLIGLFFTGSSALMLVTQIPSGYLADRYGRKTVTVYCMVALPIIFVLWNFTDNWVALLILYMAANGFWSMTWPATLALLTDSVPIDLLGTAFGIRMTGVRLGSTIGPIVAGSLFVFYGYSSIFLVAALLYLAGVPLAMLLKEKRHAADEKKYHEH